MVSSGRVNARWAPLSILVVASALGAWAGIRASQAVPVAETPAPVEAAVPAPAGLVAEASCARPDATWHKVQAAVGGVLLLAPPTFRELLAAVAGVPSLASVVDDGSPVYAAVSESGGWVVAARAVSAQRARSTLEADSASGLRVDSHAGKMDVLAAPRTWVGLAGTWVVVASDRDALTTLGPYAYRTLPTLPPPKADLVATVSHAELDGPIRAMLGARWAALRAWLLAKDDEQRRDHGGREPDLGDPKALVAELDAIEKTYESRVAAMDRADAALDLDDDGAHLRVTLAAPRAGDVATWVDDLEGGSPQPLASSSGEALATIFWRSDPNDRARAAKEANDTLERVLGDRLPASDRAKLGAALESIAKARAGWALVSVSGGAESGVLLRLATNDASAIAATVEGVVDLAKQPSWAKWDADALGVTKIARTSSHATFDGARGTIRAAWSPRPGELDLAAGVDADTVLASAAPPLALASDPKVAAWLRTLGGSVVWAAVARPLLVAPSPRSDPALVAFLHGHRSVVLDARASNVLVREIVALVRSN